MPVCPICFWSCWPTPACALKRLPAPSTPMSWMVTPASVSAPFADSLARSMRSFSPWRPNFVMYAPRIQTLSVESLISGLTWFEGERDGFGAVVVGARDERRHADGHAELHVLGIGRHVLEVALHRTAAVEVDQRRHVRRGHAGHRAVHDRERAELPAGRQLA